ncbi:hypothetical protein CVT24_000104 [Panaeolus cyanescens]|uniref:MARVEL domain-containing protein n=1 Tax=Panaeolus cyanescens TaxID=181874 RepID=A0A409W7Q0_9AGAR|nr:hypothetical protein CVT24_000104 [Panaeolus cyanescens]
MGQLQIWRNIALALCLLMNLAATGLVVHFLVITVIPPAGPFIYSFQIVGLVVGTIGLLFIPALLIGKISVIFDLIIMFILWVLWLTEVVLVGQFRQSFLDYGRSDYIFWANYYGYLVDFPYSINCTSITGLIHFLALLIYAIVRQSRGNPIWKQHIRRINEPVVQPVFMPQYYAPQMTMPWPPNQPVAYGAPMVYNAWPAGPNYSPQPMNNDGSAITTPPVAHAPVTIYPEKSS